MKYQLIKKKYRFRLYEDETYQTGIILSEDIDTPYFALSKDGLLTGKKGYAWDGSSIPFKRTLRILSLGIWKPDKYSKIASLFHDVLYQMMGMGLLSRSYRFRCDYVYKVLCIKGGMKKRDANRRLWFLLNFGKIGVQGKEKVYEV